MSYFLKTPWKFDTSEETSVSIFLTLASGRLFMQNEDDGEKLIINYRCASLGAGKGPPLGLSLSTQQDPSGGFDNIGVAPGKDFGYLSFPCKGYMIGVGASAGIVGTILNMDITGGGVTAVIFGMAPVFAGVRIWGEGRTLCPGGGFTGGVASFWIEDTNDGPASDDSSATPSAYSSSDSSSDTGDIPIPLNPEGECTTEDGSL